MEGALVQLVMAMNEDPPPDLKDWKVIRNQALSVCVLDCWFRGVVVRKQDLQYSVYRLDLGDLVTVGREQLRPLPPRHLSLPPGCLQCCLAGVGPVEGEEWTADVVKLFSNLLNDDPSYLLTVEMLGRVQGDRWAVRLTGLEDGVDVGMLLVETGLAVERKDLLEELML